MIISNNVSAKDLNSFSVDVNVKTLIEIESLDDLDRLELTEPFKVLGGGSNILLTSDLNQPLLVIKLTGITVVKNANEYTLVKVGAGENWHSFVEWTLRHDLGGIENLSLIPGKCGAAPMQNIGAYGVEIKDVLHAVYAYDIQQKRHVVLHHSECGFAYRSSYFKNKWKDRYIITAIVLRLSNSGHHKIHTHYGAIQSKLNENKIDKPSIQDVSRAVIAIRRDKLPDPKLLPNAGSFFKNPVVSSHKMEELKESFPDIVHYPHEGMFKLAAAWLIDQAGWRGYRNEKAVGTHKNQALVIVNEGHAHGSDIYALAKEIMTSVASKFGIQLEPEVNIWN